MGPRGVNLSAPPAPLQALAQQRRIDDAPAVVGGLGLEDSGGADLAAAPVQDQVLVVEMPPKLGSEGKSRRWTASGYADRRDGAAAERHDGVRRPSPGGDPPGGTQVAVKGEL